MCDNKSSALSVAMAFPFHYEDTIHGDGAEGYYPHYHPWRRATIHPHIWFYPTP